jgi:hypothetical protein
MAANPLCRSICFLNSNKLYKKFSKSKEILNKDGSPRENSTHERLKQEIALQEAEIDRLQQESKTIPERIDISNLEDYRCFECISNESKNLFDFVNSCVWNARKQMVECLLPFYENKNEYIDLFYTLSPTVTDGLKVINIRSRSALNRFRCPAAVLPKNNFAEN